MVAWFGFDRGIGHAALPPEHPRFHAEPSTARPSTGAFLRPLTTVSTGIQDGKTCVIALGCLGDLVTAEKASVPLLLHLDNVRFGHPSSRGQ